MSTFSYVAIDPEGSETRGSIEVCDQAEAIRRIKEMGLFPTRVLEDFPARPAPRRELTRTSWLRQDVGLPFPGWSGGVKPRTLSVFTRQLATLVEAGMPLVRGLRTLQQQEPSQAMKRVIGKITNAIENGSSFTEAVASCPRVFNRLYVNMVRAGEIGGALDTTLARLSEFQEKSAKIKGKVKAALFYPCAVLTVAMGILVLMMMFVVPRFKEVFDGLMHGLPLPALTLCILKVSQLVKTQFLTVTAMVTGVIFLGWLVVRTQWGRWFFDRCKLAVPPFGPVLRKAAIARFSRTLGTLISSGVPILQSLEIVRETAGNVVMAGLISAVHDSVKEGDPIAPTLRASGVVPVMVAGMVDVGEQTGALPEMLMKIADNCDDDVDNAVNALTSLLEPLLIVLLALVVGGIVIAMFLPLLRIMEAGFDHAEGEQ